jgi:PAS domain S-box-containing protein
MSGKAAPAAELVADDQGRYVDCNDAACELLGYSRDELLKLSVWDLTPEGNEVDGLLLWQEFIRIGAQAGIYWLVRKDGSLVEVEYRAVARATPRGHLSRLTPIDTGRSPFPASKLPRRGSPPGPG